MKKLQLLTLALLCSLAVTAAQLPSTSTASAPTWYFVKFMSGGNVLEAQTSGAQVQTALISGSDDQLWRLEGSNTVGYRLISRSGKTLYTNSTAKEGMFYSSTSASSNYTFSIKACTLPGFTDGFTISPKANSGVYMNQWGGAGTGKQLGLWNSVDENCPLTFYTESEFQSELKKSSLPLIPMPTTLTIHEGSVSMGGFTTVAYTSEDYKALAEQYADMLSRISGTTLSTTLNPGATTATRGTILMRQTSGVQDETYSLVIGTDASAIVEASQPHGFFNALQTLRQLFYDAKYNGNGNVQVVSINDTPLFGYRGFMLDIARHYFDKEEVKKLLDVMALYKINKFHWHLTDDQGWRIEIPEYPRLTEVGTIRASSNTKSNPQFYDDTEYGRGMFYTLEDLSEIVDYAATLHIDIMPEIDLPGHMVAAIASYPEEFSCNPNQAIENNGKYIVRVDAGISEDVLNVAKPAVMDFLKCVLRHMAEVFPYPIIHIGGDECPTNAWQNRVNANDAEFKNWMAANKLTSVNDIQPWLVNELGQWLKKEYGKDVVCWNELTNHWNTSLETQPIIMCYSGDGKNAMKAAANLGLRTIYTGCWPFYLDMYQTYSSGNINNASAHQFNDPYTGGYGNNTLQAVYEATPTSSIGGKENLCLGVGGNLWTETVNNNLEAEHQYFPRMLALAEVGWLPQNKKSWISFRKRVQPHFKVLKDLGVNYATYDLEAPALSPLEEAQTEAERLLQDAKPDAVGYPSAAAYDNLRAALSNATAESVAQLQSAISAFKATPITQPQEGKTYRIISASVAWGQNYEGSSMYYSTADKAYRFHYTMQTEPEELFYFAPYDGGFRISNRLSSKKVYLGSVNSKVSASTLNATTLIQPASAQSATPAYYDYVPGVVTITSKNYSTGTTARRLNAQNDGFVYVKSDATVGHTGCWRIVEVTDFTVELQALVQKCSIKGILTDQLVLPATEELEQGPISESVYDTYAAIYAAYLKLTYSPNLTGVSHTPATTKGEQDSPAYDLQGRRAHSAARSIVVSAGGKTIR